MAKVVAPSATLLSALLASVAGDLRGLRCADLTHDGAAATWLAQAHAASLVAEDQSADVVICEHDDLAAATRRCVDGGLLLLRTPRSQPAVGRTELDALGLMQTSSVRDQHHVWTLLARVAVSPELDGAPLASVVLVCRDQARALWRVLAMLAVDEGPYPWELVVVDRGSFDETAALLRGVEGDLHIVPAPRGLPLADALHLGFQAARGRWLIHVDLDFVPAAGFLPAALDAALAQPGIAVLTGPLADGPTGRPLGPERLAAVMPRANRQLFALARDAWASAPAWSGDELAVDRALAQLGLAVVVPTFCARRPRSTAAHQSGICL